MKNTFITKTFILAACLLLGACASTRQQSDIQANDPLEPMNRATYAFNKAIDQNLYQPITDIYQAVLPETPRQGVSNAMRNLREPWVFINDILQLKFKRAGQTLSRFVINSTLGIGGLFKVSDDMGIKYHSEDFGQTLAVWGVGDGPYLIIPFVGPSSGRDFAGFTASFFGDPVTLVIADMDEKGLNLTRTGVDALDARSRLNRTIQDTYRDPDGYVLMRSAFRQNRRYEIYDGNAPNSEADDIFDELETDEQFGEQE
ncbi:MlaA family lipoprotein [Kordiimonas pumila]|uniref:VacJ family lipoprotein n=1 Tax=Kordiimonas pumila TaxID=2161677 RepID=A0ABV7D8D3_9PROT|nr:VacJ family lipoprotein [Kordiimonas pumila]